MTQEQKLRERFEDKLLYELKRAVVAEAPRARPRGAGRTNRPRAGIRRGAAAALVAAVVVTIVVVVPFIGGDGARSPAFAVTPNADGTVTVEIWSIEDAAGLERRLEDHGVPTAVYFLPAGKLCSPRGQDEGSPPVSDRQIELERQRVVIGESEDGAFTFTVDRSRLLPGYTLLISMQYDEPEYGQPGTAVPSVSAEYTSRDVSDCELADGEVDGWFQTGAGASS